MKPVATYCFDTNIYRRLYRGRIQIPPAKDKRVALSFVSALELVDQLQRSSAASFEEISGAIALARKHMKWKYLVPPYDFMAKMLWGRPEDKRYLQHSRKGFGLASRVGTYADVSCPIRFGDKMFRLQDFGAPRMDHQKKWIRGLEGARKRILIDAGVEPLTRESVLPDPKSQDFVRFLKTPGWLDFFARVVVPDGANSEQSRRQREAIPRSLHAAGTFFGSILQLVLVEGYKFKNKANDAYDYYQLYYLCQKEMIFVTDDRRLQLRVKPSAQADRIWSLEQFLSA